MLCPKCNSTIYDGEKFCANCGSEINACVQSSTAQVKPIFTTPIQQSFSENEQKNMTEEDLPEQYRPLSPWSYFGLSILFTIPLVGFIFLIVFSFNGSNINRRNFARSYWCALIIVGTVAILFAIISLLFLKTTSFSTRYY